ncbi:unnamed protein product [Adineta ricciae]|uniref:Uncharacterized protein n=1 Tax=Adineta ricciae TaxID=249248 RepID=A0A813T9N4_ADIRI|nr:unnamed protein product [Adineta ricciae]CAF1225053.1 unnamed protein product [Adineta ricciae]
MQILESKVLNAIQRAQYKQLALYIRHKYKLNFVTEDGRNGLFYALDIADAHQRQKMIKFCLDHGIDPLQKETTSGFTPLHEAISRQQVESVQLLLANVSGEINWREFDTQGRTILHLAVEANSIPILDALLNVMNHYGVSVDIPDRNGLTPYLLAIKLHLRDMVQILLKKGHASRRQCDLPTHRSANDWEIAGIEDHSLLVRDKLQHEINNAMNEGKISKARQLKQIYDTQLIPSKTESIPRRSTFLSPSITSGLNVKSRTSINEMIGQLPEGVIPDSYVKSEQDSQTFHLTQNSSGTLSASSLLPPISTTRRYRPTLTVNALVDLFQVAAEQCAPSYRPSHKTIMNKALEQQARQKQLSQTHRSTLATLNSVTHPSSTLGYRRSIHISKR